MGERRGTRGWRATRAFAALMLALGAAGVSAVADEEADCPSPHVRLNPEYGAAEIALPELEVDVSDHALKLAWGVEFGEPGWKPSWQAVLWRDEVAWSGDGAKAHAFWEAGLVARPQRLGIGCYLGAELEIEGRLHVFGELGAELSARPNGPPQARGVVNVGLEWAF